MKKIYLLMSIFLLACFLASGQDTVIVIVKSTELSEPHYINVDKKIADSVTAWGYVAKMIAIADIKANPSTYDYSNYVAAVITESGGSGDVSAYGVSGVQTLPTVCYKAYAIRYSKTDWPWVDQDQDGVFNAEYIDSMQIPECTKMEVLTEHDILSGYEVGDTFSFSTSQWAAGAHIQTFSFEHSNKENIKSNATALLESVWAASGPNAASYAAAQNCMYAIEENPDSKRTVVWGVHNLYLGSGATTKFWQITKNALKWVLKEGVNINNKPAIDYILRCYPNPASGITFITFNSTSVSNANISLMSITGQEIAVLFSGKSIIGNNKIGFDASQYNPGIYFLKLQVDNKTQIKKLIIK